MKTAAFIGHSFHQKTKSTLFFIELIRRNGLSVECFWDESWNGGSSISWTTVEHFDVVVMFQVMCPLGGDYFRRLHPNVIFIPMLDQFGIWQGPLFNLTSFWEPLQGSKVINFSFAAHAMSTGAGLASHCVHYFQPIPEKNQNSDRSGLHGFFWLRRPTELNWSTIRKLLGETRFDSLHIHLAHDPGTSEPELPTEDEVKRHNITFSKWFADKKDYFEAVGRSNVYFAPRMEEGIGQSFLEAMAAGQCVVAPNQGTMNEYIISGINGLLFNNKDPQPLDFSRVGQLGQAARLSAELGRQRWEAGEKDLMDFILTPSAQLYAGKYQHTQLLAPRTQGQNFVSALKSRVESNSALRKLKTIVVHPTKKILKYFAVSKSLARKGDAL